jgi:hypothetical protein
MDLDLGSLTKLLQGHDPVVVVLAFLGWAYLKSILAGLNTEDEKEKHKKVADKREAALDVLAAAIEEAQSAQAKEMVKNLVEGTELEEMVENARLRAENGTGKHKKG